MSPHAVILPVTILFVSVLYAQQPITDRFIVEMNSALSAGQWDRAMQLNDSVLHYAQVETPDDAATMLWGSWIRVRILLVRQEFETCRQFLVKTIKTYEHTTPTKYHARLHAELGSVYIGTKDLELAISSFHDALKASDTLDHVTSVIIYESLAQAHMESWQPDSALKYIDLALHADTIHEKLKMRGHVTNVMYKAMILAHMDRHAEAESLGLFALESPWLNREQVSHSYILAEMATIYFLQDAYIQALQYIQEADALYRQNLDSTGWYYEFLAEQGIYRLALGQVDTAIHFFQAIPPLVKQEMESKTSFLSVRGREVYADRSANMSDYLITMLHHAPESDFGREVYDFLAFYKGFSMRSLKTLQRTVYEINDPVLTTRHQQWINTRSVYYGQLGKGAVTDSLRKVLEHTERVLFQRADSLQGDHLSSMTWNLVSGRLHVGEVAIEFVRFADILNDEQMRYGAVLIRPDSERPRYVSLCTETEITAALARRFGETDFEFIHRIYDRDNQLYDLIWKRLEDELGGSTKVYLAASGVLHQLAHDAIRTPSGEPLSARHQIVMLNSTAELPTRQSFKVGQNPPSAVLYGGIAYDVDVPERSKNREVDSMNVHMRYGGRLQADWKFLEQTQVEVKSIKDILETVGGSCTLRDGLLATEHALSADLANGTPEIVHIATHGLSVKRNSSGLARSQSEGYAQSGLVMAAANDCFKAKATIEGFGDGILTGPEIASLNMLGTKLVVLSACESGLGEVSRTDEVFGLQRAFKIAGVDHILYTLWKVPDQTTMEFMEAFYKNLAEGQPLHSAFAAAKSDMQARYPTYYWASFQLIY